MSGSAISLIFCRLLQLCFGVDSGQPNRNIVHIDQWEPPASKYWVADTRFFQVPDSTRRFPILNFTMDSMTSKAFDQLVQEGRPFVVRALGKAHAMQSWNCQFFSHNAAFRDVEGRREYADSSIQPRWMPLKHIMSMTSMSDATGQGVDRDKAEASPYYVGIKDVQHGSPEELSRDSHYSPTWTSELLDFVQNHSTVPAFMRASNLKRLQETPEFWFIQGGQGKVGAKAHVDVHPESTWSLQLCGQKRWRVSVIAPRAAPHVMKLYQDGQIYKRPEHLSWNQFEDVVLDAGDALFFGPAFIHQTLSENVGPAASVTWQFDDPMPAVFMRNFMPRLRFTADSHALWPQMQHLVTQAEKAQLSRNLKSSDLQNFLDIDGDGDVKESERREVISLWKALVSEVKAKVPKILWQEMNLGLQTVIEDEHELRGLPKRVRKLVRKWEASALELDASAAPDLLAHSEL